MLGEALNKVGGEADVVTGMVEAGGEVDDVNVPAPRLAPAAHDAAPVGGGSIRRRPPPPVSVRYCIATTTVV
jgi:hypothetical protein